MVDTRIPLSVPYLHGNEQRYLDECIRTNWVSYVGPFVSRFEKEFAETVGGTYRGRQVGTHGDAGCFSFNGNKIITSGGGGMVTTDDAALAKRMRYLSTQARDDPGEYVHESIGFNYRLTNVQAAVGVA